LDAFRRAPTSSLFLTTTTTNSTLASANMMSEPMDMSDNPNQYQDQPLRSEADNPDLDDAPIPRRRRALDDQVEKVTDETGEMVRGAFLQFLETYFLP
jgi:hypothetical protein